MWICLASNPKDIHLAKANLQWMRQLSDRLPHGCLLTLDHAVSWQDACELVVLANVVFQRVEVVAGDEPWESWPAGANYLFKISAQYLERRGIGPWFWCEPDCIPLKKDWLDQLEAAYRAGKTAFMGAVMDAIEPNMPPRYLAGCACYPMNTWERMSGTWDEAKAFDVATAGVVVPYATNTSLIQHFWGIKDLPPTFEERHTEQSPQNAFTLLDLHDEAVVFHRSKDLSLLKLLGFKPPSAAKIEIQVCLPVHSGDAKLMLKNLHWMNALHGKKQAKAVLLVDSSVQHEMEKQLIHAASAVFGEVAVHRYSAKGHGWPQGPNCAFQEACRVMVDAPWLFHEADAVAITPDWLEQLSDEYMRGGKFVMGSVVDCMDNHCNGCAIFPPNFEKLVPAVRNLREAFDVALQHQIKSMLHNGNRIMQHHLSPPSFASAPDLRAIKPGIVFFHPAKSGHLQDRLAERL